MEPDEIIVENKASMTLTYMPLHEHVRDFFLSQWVSILIHFLGFLSAYCALIEAFDFFYPKQNLSNSYTFTIGLGVASFGAIIKCIHIYRNTAPNDLMHESTKIKKIAFSKKPYWEYAIAYELIKSRIQNIDRKLEDLISSRVHIKIQKIMTRSQYIEWLQLRPSNLTGIIHVAKQLLIFDLIDAIHADESKEVDYKNLIRIVDLIKNLYESAYNFEVEGREIQIPDGFEVIHEIQADWIMVVREGFHQMLDILQTVAARKKGDFSPLSETIVFRALPRLDDFCNEIKRIELNL